MRIVLPDVLAVEFNRHEVPTVEKTATPEEIRDYCRGKIAHYKVPRYVKFVDGFPMTVTGKVQKFVVREASVKELGLEDAARVKMA